MYSAYLWPISTLVHFIQFLELLSTVICILELNLALKHVLCQDKTVLVLLLGVKDVLCQNKTIPLVDILTNFICMIY